MKNYNLVTTPLKARFKFNEESKSQPIDPMKFNNLIRSLRYLVYTQLDLTYLVGCLSGYMEAPSLEHMAALKRVLRYVKGTINLRLMYKRENDLTTIRYSDSDHVGDVADQKSTTDIFFFHRQNLISWTSQKQKIVTLSSCEAKYVAATVAACQGL